MVTRFGSAYNSKGQFFSRYNSRRSDLSNNQNGTVARINLLIHFEIVKINMIRRLGPAGKKEKHQVQGE
ncbi:hypothetical protein KKI24_02145 [bacterium]|nr:hypothetical protein [bacterium]